MAVYEPAAEAGVSHHLQGEFSEYFQMCRSKVVKNIIHAGYLMG